eukprot:TRINITY_DN2210_c0_g2_i1.p1 TRINITY_DN2210_c0_g2~~TRINITY_DN2210_c0_g2_i1.p1  ORF type:complete len:249 (-),score=64.03 TRINITY_DN2210_c0_g2_i1:32-778(-)
MLSFLRNRFGRQNRGDDEDDDEHDSDERDSDEHDSDDEKKAEEVTDILPSEKEREDMRNQHIVIHSLSEKMPIEIATHVACFAGFCKKYLTAQKNVQVSGGSMNMMYLSLDIPSTMSPSFRCVEVRVSIKSHDQGWSSYRSEHNTYNGSWTWGDLRVVKQQHQEGGGEGEGGGGGGGGEEVVHEIQRVYTNLHAVNTWQVHKKIFNDRDSEFIQSIRPGVTIQLYLRSEFPGWVNYTSSACFVVVYSL